MKKFFKQYTPDRSKVNLVWLDKHLHDPCLWNWNRKSISKAFAVGLFCALLPIPFQMIAAAALAVAFSANILLSISLVWITNPITMGPIFYFNYKLGCIILDTRIDPNFSFSWDYLREVLGSGLPALLVGSLVAASIAAAIGYSAIQWLYRHRVGKRIKRWKNQRFDV
ncbi:MAG: DUF2062 domain-containing protein [Gammaproteobacteria bacterium]|nr:DUF2062 domain-containing protein [Gammaproteobacteria bacterium]